MYVIRIDGDMKAELETAGVVTVFLKNREGQEVAIWSTGDPAWMTKNLSTPQE